MLSTARRGAAVVDIVIPVAARAAVSTVAGDHTH